MIDVELSGYQHVLAELNALADTDLRDRALKAGVVKVATHAEAIMQHQSPKKTGTLEKSINRRQASAKNRALMNVANSGYAVIVGPNKRIGGLHRQRIANVLEHGAKAHDIVPGKSTLKLDLLYEQGIKKKAKVLYDKQTGKFFGRLVKHKGFSAREWIKGSDAQLGSGAEALFYAGVQDFLNRHRSA